MTFQLFKVEIKVNSRVRAVNKYSDFKIKHNRFCFDEWGKVFTRQLFQKRGLELVMNPEKDKTMVQDLLEFKDSIDYVIENSFKNSICFQDVKKVSPVISLNFSSSMSRQIRR